MILNNLTHTIIYQGGTILNGFILVLPILFIRYGLLRIISKGALNRAAYYPPVVGIEKIAFIISQITMNIMFIYLIFLKAKLNTTINCIGLGIFLLGIILYTLSTIDYAKPKANGFNCNGLYRISRNPMYISFFLYFLGCSILTNSWVLFIILILFQISFHYIVLSEERWCEKEFGIAYTNYAKRVRRYI